MNKRDYVKSQGQTRPHHCHWPGCERQIPPALWGCRQHWFALPKYMRDMVWAAYRPGQEIDGLPSREYLSAMQCVKIWIRVHVDRGSSHGAEDKTAVCVPEQGELFGEGKIADNSSHGTGR